MLTISGDSGKCSATQITISASKETTKQTSSAASSNEVTIKSSKQVVLIKAPKEATKSPVAADLPKSKPTAQVTIPRAAHTNTPKEEPPTPA